MRRDKLQTTIALNPDFSEAHYNLGVTFQKLDRLEEAEASYREATALQSDYTEAHNNLGITLQELGRLGSRSKLQTSDSIES